MEEELSKFFGRKVNGRTQNNRSRYFRDEISGGAIGGLRIHWDGYIKE
ncbi:MAG: hypothetical protein ACTSV2_12705 [Candidatus Thorarchaeota archaeon]